MRVLRFIPLEVYVPVELELVAGSTYVQQCCKVFLKYIENHPLRLILLHLYLTIICRQLHSTHSISSAFSGALLGRAVLPGTHQIHPDHAIDSIRFQREQHCLAMPAKSRSASGHPEKTVPLGFCPQMLKRPGLFESPHADRRGRPKNSHS